MTSKKVSTIILSIFALTYLVLGVPDLLQYPLSGLLLLAVAALIVCTIYFGIMKGKKAFIWVGIVINAIQILDGVSALINKFIFGYQGSILLSLIIGLLAIYPIRVLYRIARNKSVTE